MKTITLHRLKQTAYATYGTLRDADGNEVCVTLELPWVDANGDGISDRNVSRIPAGTYTAERYLSPGHGYVVFRLSGVPGRSAIELHIANLPSDLKGCIGVGSSFGKVFKANGETGPGILASRAAFQTFMAKYPDQRVSLTVIDPPALPPSNP